MCKTVFKRMVSTKIKLKTTVARILQEKDVEIKRNFHLLAKSLS
jgi:hypothetical protein